MRPGAVRLQWLRPETADSVTMATWHATLDAQEQARAARFVFDSDRQIFIAAHALARRMLSDVGTLPPESWRFATGHAGRPELYPSLGHAWLRFNLSHTSGLVACAVAADEDIGLDVENLQRREVSPGLAERYFAPEEVALLDAAPDRHDTFLRIWTLKEAFVKATGDGIGLGLDRFAFTLDLPRLTFAPGSAGDPSRWRFLQIRPTPRHILSVALRRENL